MKDKTRERIVGLLILVAYALIFGGNPAHKIQGMILEVVSGTAVILIAILMFPLFKPNGKFATFLYIILRFLEGGLLILTGILFLSTEPQILQLREAILASHGYLFAVAALVFYYLLYISRLVPRFISIWGVVASSLVVAVNLLTGFGILPELMILFLPIILNELTLATWLISRGFHNTSSD